MKYWRVLFNTLKVKYDNGVAEHEVTATITPVLVLSSKAYSDIQAGKSIMQESNRSFDRLSTLCALMFPSKEAATDYIKTCPAGKFYLMEITSHICTDVVLSENC